jgi:glycosyltransferase involved in cell wall biosynthesis
VKAYLSSLGLGTLIRRLCGVRLGRLYQYSPRELAIKQLSSVERTDCVSTIAIVTPSFNQARFVGQTIKSVLDQHYPNLEYVVQDSCSKDGTESILRSFSNTSLKVHIEPDNGQTDALNIGFSHTTAEIMCYLNSDDLLLPGTLPFVANYFEENPLVDVIYGNRLIIDESGMEIGRWILPEHNADVLRFVDYVPQESMYWRRRIWDKVGAKFDSNLEYAMDWDLILRFLDSAAVFTHVPELFGIFRVHGNQKSQSNFLTRGVMEMNSLRMRHRNDDLSSLQRFLLHCRYLLRHVRADATWQRSVRLHNQ